MGKIGELVGTDEMEKQLEEKKLLKPFEVTSVCRADILDGGEFTREEVLKLDDDDMKQIASKMADAYCDNGFWIDLPIMVEHIINSK
jgi:hypothetical protein